MKNKKAVIFFISAAVVAILLGGAIRVIYAQGANSQDMTVLAKLNEVLSNQKVIMDELAGLKEDLRIIKIRITQSQ